MPTIDRHAAAFRAFNRFFSRSSERYGHGVTGIISHKAAAVGVYLALIAGAIGLSYLVPGGFVPGQDKQYLVALNLASSTPAWLRGLGGKPMYMGLDLRGGRSDGEHRSSPACQAQDLAHRAQDQALSQRQEQ